MQDFSSGNMPRYLHVFANILLHNCVERSQSHAASNLDT
jgi:hypothetical protein